MQTSTTKRSRNMFNNYSCAQELLCAEVFARLPVKTLLIIRCVCKAWCSFITHDPNFAQLHLKTYKNNAENKLLLSRERNTWKELMFVRDTDTLTKLAKLDATSYLKVGYVDGVLNEQVFVPKTYEEIAYLSTDDCHVVGYVDGVVIINTYDFRVNRGQSRIVLWNPAIRKTFEVPTCNDSVMFKGTMNFGFGFDCASNEYKVVAVSTPSNRPRSRVFRLGTGAWSSPKAKRMCPIVHKLYLEKFSSTTNFEGAIYWLASDDKTKRTRYSHFLCFDLSSEAFTCVTLPTIEHKQGKTQAQKRCPSILHNKLAIVDLDFTMQHVSIWVKENYYGIAYSWTKLYSVNLRIRKFLYLKEDGEMLFYGKPKQVVSYNFENQQAKTLGRYDRQGIVFMDTYKESLVLLGGYSKQASI